MSFQEGFGNSLATLNVVREGFDRGTARRKKNALAQLTAQQAMGGSPDYMAVAENDGDPMAFRADAQGQQDRLRSELGRDAAMILAAPVQLREGMYQQVLPKARKAGLNAPERYSAELDPILQNVATWAAGGAKGIGVQSTYIDAGGNRVAIMRDGSTQVLGQNAPNNQIIEGAGGFYGVNRGNLSAAPVTLGGAPPPQNQPQATQQPGQDANTTMAALMALGQIPGVSMSSGPRSPSHNAKVGGKDDSQHLATAGDYVMPQHLQAQFIALVNKNPDLMAIPEGDHIHVQSRLRGGGASGGSQLQPAPPAPKAPTVPAGYRLTPDGNQEMIPGGPAQVAADARADAAAARKAAEGVKSDAKQRAETARQTEAATVANQLVGAIDGLTAHPGFKSLGTVWGDAQINTPLIRSDAKDARARLENISGQVALSTMARLKALSATGATGFGSLTAPELRLLQNSIDTLQSENISNEQLIASMKNIRDFMDKTANWQASALPSDPGAAGNVASGAREIASQAEYDALPSGATYLEDGQQYRKP